MALVGEIILGAREMFTDISQSLPAPGTPVATAITDSTAPWTTGTYYFTVTQLNQFGETEQSTEAVQAIANPNTTFRIDVAISPGATKARVYVGTSSGGENRYAEFGVVTGGVVNNLIMPALTSLVGNPPPTRGTAYLPDTDGGALSVAAIYRWINDGLNLASTICDGLPDFAAVATDSGQPAYVFPGTWNKINLCWYDGYPVYVDRKDNVFRRNNVTGIVGNLSLIQSTDRVIVEAYPQPTRTSGRTTLASNLSASATSASLVASNFVLGFGLAQIGDEQVYYASNGSGTMSGLTRGMAGTVPTAWPAGTPVSELNLMVTGTRAPRGYTVGMSTSTFYLPPGWEDAIITYLVARFRKAEQQTQESQALLNEFTAKVQKLTATKIVAGPRQIPANRGNGVEILSGYGSFFGGVILP